MRRAREIAKRDEEAAGQAQPSNADAAKSQQQVISTLSQLLRTNMFLSFACLLVVLSVLNRVHRFLRSKLKETHSSTSRSRSGLSMTGCWYGKPGALKPRMTFPYGLLFSAAHSSSGTRRLFALGTMPSLAWAVAALNLRSPSRVLC